jgi:DNA-binding NarL/FixJ family response regulator
VLAAAPGVRVVCLTASVSVEETRQLLEAGAVACVMKDDEFDAIIGAVRAAARAAA